MTKLFRGMTGSEPINESSAPDDNMQQGNKESHAKEGSPNPLGITSAQFRRLQSLYPVAQPKQSVRMKSRRIIRAIKRAIGFEHFLPFIAITLYTLVGAAVFLAIEGSADDARRDAAESALEKSREGFAQELMIRMRPGDGAEGNKNISGELLVRYDWLLRGIEEYENRIGFRMLVEERWTFVNAMYYSGTIYTTIGYGNIVPHTTIGRIVTVVYAIIGLPLFFSALSDIRRCFMLIILAFMRFLRRQIGCLRRNRHNRSYHSIPITDGESGRIANGLEKADKPADTATDVADSRQLQHDPQVPVSLALLVTVGWMFLCAALFYIWEEDWSYGTSLYFVFISFSTIGLGDVIPEHPEYMIAVFYFVIIGLSLVGLLIDVIQQNLRNVVAGILLKLLIEYQKHLEEGHGAAFATASMVDVWKKNRAVKIALRLIGKAGKTEALKRFRDEAKAQGIEIPEALRQLDPEKGMPLILCEQPQEGPDPPNPTWPSQGFTEDIESAIMESLAPVTITRAVPIGELVNKATDTSFLQPSLVHKSAGSFPINLSDEPQPHKQQQQQQQQKHQSPTQQRQKSPAAQTASVQRRDCATGTDKVPPLTTKTTGTQVSFDVAPAKKARLTQTNSASVQTYAGWTQDPSVLKKTTTGTQTSLSLKEQQPELAVPSTNLLGSRRISQGGFALEAAPPSESPALMLIEARQRLTKVQPSYGRTSEALPDIGIRRGSRETSPPAQFRLLEKSSNPRNQTDGSQVIMTGHLNGDYLEDHPIGLEQSYFENDPGPETFRRSSGSAAEQLVAGSASVYSGPAGIRALLPQLSFIAPRESAKIDVAALPKQLRKVSIARGDRERSEPIPESSESSSSPQLLKQRRSSIANTNLAGLTQVELNHKRVADLAIKEEEEVDDFQSVDGFSLSTIRVPASIKPKIAGIRQKFQQPGVPPITEFATTFKSTGRRSGSGGDSRLASRRQSVI